MAGAIQTGNTTSGAQGKLMITASGGTAKLHLRVFDWELTSDPNLQSDMSAESGGNEHRGSIKTDYSLSFNVRISSGFQPEDTVVGLVEGTEVQIYLQVGTLTGHNNWKHIIGSVRKKGCDVNGWATYSVQSYAQEAKPALAAWSDV